MELHHLTESVILSASQTGRRREISRQERPRQENRAQDREHMALRGGPWSSEDAPLHFERMRSGGEGAQGYIEFFAFAPRGLIRQQSKVSRVWTCIESIVAYDSRSARCPGKTIRFAVSTCPFGKRVCGVLRSPQLCPKFTESSEENLRPGRLLGFGPQGAGIYASVPAEPV
jgi:hypothetical protein